MLLDDGPELLESLGFISFFLPIQSCDFTIDQQVGLLGMRSGRLVEDLVGLSVVVLAHERHATIVGGDRGGIHRP